MRREVDFGCLEKQGFFSRKQSNSKKTLLYGRSIEYKKTMYTIQYLCEILAQEQKLHHKTLRDFDTYLAVRFSHRSKNENCDLLHKIIESSETKHFAKDSNQSCENVWAKDLCSLSGMNTKFENSKRMVSKVAIPSIIGVGVATIFPLMGCCLLTMTTIAIPMILATGTAIAATLAVIAAMATVIIPIAVALSIVCLGALQVALIALPVIVIGIVVSPFWIPIEMIAQL